MEYEGKYLEKYFNMCIAFTPLLFTPYFIQFIHSAILHTQVTHTFYLVF